MNEIDKFQRRIDKFLQVDDFKGAIKYLSTLKGQGVSAENLSFFQVYISRIMSKKKEIATDPKQNESMSQTHFPKSLSPRQKMAQELKPVIQQVGKILNKSSECRMAKIQSPRRFKPTIEFKDFTKYQPYSFTKNEKGQNNTSIDFYKQQESSKSLLNIKGMDSECETRFDSSENVFKERSDLTISRENRGSSEDKCSRAKLGQLLIKLPSQNKIESAQYFSLKNLIKKGVQELHGKINQKYMSANALVEQAQHHSRCKNYALAQEQYEKAQKLDSSNIKIFVERANCLKNQGKFNEAMENYNLAYNSNPPIKTQFNILFNKASILKNQNQRKLAIECFSKASLLNPQSTNTLFNKALTQYNIGEVEECIESYSRALKSNPVDVQVILNQGLALREIGEFNLAIDSFQKAAKIKSSNAKSLMYKGNALFQIDLLEEALKSYQEAVDIDPILYEAHLNMGVVYHELGKQNKELECYDKVLSLNPKDEKALFNKGLALREKGEIMESLAAFDQVLQIDGKMIDALINKGMIHYILEKFEDSIVTYKKALAIDNTSLLATINLGLSYRAIKQHQKALKLYFQSQKIHSKSSEMYFQIGEVFKETLTFRYALSYYQKSIELSPINFESIFQKGICLFMINEQEAAWDCFQLCIKVSPTETKALIAQGIIKESQGKLKESIKIYEGAQKISKGKSEKEDIAIICLAHVYKQKTCQYYLLNESQTEVKIKEEEVQQNRLNTVIRLCKQLINKPNKKISQKFSAYLNLCAISVHQIFYFSKFNSVKNSNNTQSQLQDGISSNTQASNAVQQSTSYSGYDIEDAYFHLLVLLSSEIKQMAQQGEKTNVKLEENYQSLTLGVLLRYLNLKKTQGLGSLGMGGGKHIVYMVLCYLYTAFKKREQKEYEDSVLYFDFLMHFNQEIEFFCRYHSFLSYLKSNSYSQFFKKLNVTLSEEIRSGNSESIYKIILVNREEEERKIQQAEEEKKLKNPGKFEPKQTQQSQDEEQERRVRYELLEQFQTELICRKISSSVFKQNKDSYQKQFAFQNILNHSHIQKINYFYTDQEENAYFIEHKQKYDLRTHLSRNLVTFDQRLHILIQVCQAISHLHDNRVVHLDIQPKSILICEDSTPLLTNFKKSNALFRSYHSSLNVNHSPDQFQFYSLPMLSTTSSSYFSIDFDIQLELSHDIKALGILFTSLLIKISPNDRMINNWHRKGFTISQQLSTTISNMISQKFTKRPNIKQVIDSLELEATTALLFSILPFSLQVNSKNRTKIPSNHISSSHIPHHNNNSLHHKNTLLSNSPKQNHFSAMEKHHQHEQQKQTSSGDNFSFHNKTTIQSTSPKLTHFSAMVQHRQHELQKETSGGDNSFLDDEDNSPNNSESVATPSSKKQQQKKSVLYKAFAQDLEDIRNHFKITIYYREGAKQDPENVVKQKIQRSMRFQFSYMEDLIRNELFISSLNKPNLILLLASINSIYDCSRSDQTDLIRRYYNEIIVQQKKMQINHQFQSSQAKLFYKVIDKPDPEKGKHKLLQNSHFKGVYQSIASLFLSDCIELIENKLRTILLDELNKKLFNQLKNQFDNFKFPPSYSIQKRKLIILDKYNQTVQQLQLPQSDIERITRDAFIHSKLLLVLKFEGYLQELGQGVFELLFNPLRDTLEKTFIFSKAECTSMTDHPLTQLITAKQLHKLKAKSFNDQIQEMEAIKKQAATFLKNKNTSIMVVMPSQALEPAAISKKDHLSLVVSPKLSSFKPSGAQIPLSSIIKNDSNLVNNTDRRNSVGILARNMQTFKSRQSTKELQKTIQIIDPSMKSTQINSPSSTFNIEKHKTRKSIQVEPINTSQEGSESLISIKIKGDSQKSIQITQRDLEISHSPKNYQLQSSSFHPNKSGFISSQNTQGDSPLSSETSFQIKNPKSLFSNTPQLQQHNHQSDNPSANRNLTSILHIPLLNQEQEAGTYVASFDSQINQQKDEEMLNKMIKKNNQFQPEGLTPKNTQTLSQKNLDSHSQIQHPDDSGNSSNKSLNINKSESKHLIKKFEQIISFNPKQKFFDLKKGPNKLKTVVNSLKTTIKSIQGVDDTNFLSPSELLLNNLDQEGQLKSNQDTKQSFALQNGNLDQKTALFEKIFEIDLEDLLQLYEQNFK